MTEVGKETENEELFPEAVFGEKDYLSEVFGLEQHDIRMYSPLTLAYIGDAAYEIVIRTSLVRKANMIPASSPDEALQKAYDLVGKDASVVVIPDGVAVLAVKEGQA